MKKFMVVIIVVLGAFLATPVIAAQFISEKNVATITEGQTIDDDLFISAETVIIDGTVNGDVYASGERVTINGTVNGDVYVASSKVEVKGIISDDLVALGQTITISGKVGAVTAAGEYIMAEKAAQISGGVLAAGNNLIFRSPVGRGITAAGSEITLDGAVERSVMLASGTITLNSETKIKGDLNYRSDESLIKNQGAEISGKTQRHTDPGRSFNWGLALWAFLSSAVVGLLLLKFMPTAMPAIAKGITGKPLPTLGWGVVVILLTPPLIILTLISVIGIPLAILSFMLFLILLYLSHIFVSLAVGTIISRWAHQPTGVYALFIAGLAILSLLGFIPVVGNIVSLFVVLFGFGGVAYYAKSRLGANSKNA
jgi:cytoskeletal protein CcmA (bactofilin family)